MKRVILVGVLCGWVVALGWAQTASGVKATGFPNGIAIKPGTLYYYTNHPTSQTVSATTGTVVLGGIADVNGSATLALGIAAPTFFIASLNADITTSASDVTTTFTGSTGTIKVWKPTASGDVTPIPSTTAIRVSWAAGGVN